MESRLPEPARSSKTEEIRHGFAEVNGVRLHYASIGTGALILFLHGFPEFWYAWRNQLAEFGRDFLAVAPDLRGYNLSSKPADVNHYRMNFLVEDVLALAEHLGHKRFILVGHDWGGVVAWVLAARYPERLEKLIIINAPHPAVFDRELRENPAQQQASQYMIAFRTAGAEQILSSNNFSILDENILQPGLRQGYFRDEDRQAYLQAWFQPGALTGGLNYYRAQAGLAGESGPASSEVLTETGSLMVKVPTLVIWGEKDPYLLTGNLEGLDQFVSDLQVRRISDGSHWVIHEQPALVNSLMRDFLAGRPEFQRHKGA